MLAAVASPLAAQSRDSAKTESIPVIQDNSFLVEEAYNQGAGVVQHITTFQRARGTSNFDASFTQEWPVGSIKHQLSYDVPVSRNGSQTGGGDIGINYRYQLLGDGEARLAISPRLSLMLPTGDWKKSRGNGAVGIDAAIPFSLVISPMVVAHFDIGSSVTPSARNSSGERARLEYRREPDSHCQQQDSANARGGLLPWTGSYRIWQDRAKRGFSDIARGPKCVQFFFGAPDCAGYRISDWHRSEQRRAGCVFLSELRASVQHAGPAVALNGRPCHHFLSVIRSRDGASILK